ncbi:MAG: hypothetical protein U0487_01830 [Patescibacteria group bacterium]
MTIQSDGIDHQEQPIIKSTLVDKLVSRCPEWIMVGASVAWASIAVSRNPRPQFEILALTFAVLAVFSILNRIHSK